VLVEGPGAADPVFEPMLKQTALRKGDQLHHGVYEQVKGDLRRTAAANGYLDARLLDNPMLVDTEARTARLKLVLETGRQYRFGAISIEQTVIRPELMRRFLRIREGEPYNTTQLLRTQFALDDSLYFSTVEVMPEDRDQVAADAVGDGGVGVVARHDGVVERRNVIDRAALVDVFRLSTVVEVLAAEEHLAAILGLEDAVGAEHAIPDTFRPRAEAVELP